MIRTIVMVVKNLVLQNMPSKLYRHLYLQICLGRTLKKVLIIGTGRVKMFSCFPHLKTLGKFKRIPLLGPVNFFTNYINTFVLVTFTYNELAILSMGS